MKSSRIAAQFVIFGIVLILFLSVVRRFLIPVTFGFLISLVARPVYLWLLARLRRKNHLSALLTTLLLTLCVVVPLVFLGIDAVKESMSLVKNLMDVSRQGDNRTTMSDFPPVANIYLAVNKVYPISEQDFVQKAKTILSKAGIAGASLLGRLVKEIPGKFLSLLFFLLSFYFALVDGPALANFIRRDSPFSATDTQILFGVIEKTSKAVMLGAVIAGLIHGIIVSFMYSILGIPHPLLFAVLTFFLSFIPVIGGGFTTYGGAVYLLVDGKPGSAIAMCIAAIIGSIADHVVRPWVLKDRMQIHPLLGLISALGGIAVFGFSGVFLGPLITALAIALFEILPSHERPGIRTAKE